MPAAYAWPSAIVPNVVNWRLEAFQAVYSQFGATQVDEFAGQRWVVELSLIQKGVSKGALAGFLARLRGSHAIFSAPFHAADNQGPLTGTPLVAAAANAEATTISTDGWTASQSPIMRAGDFFTVNDELKVCVSDSASDGAGLATIDFEPGLRSSLADNSAIEVAAPYGHWRLGEDVGMVSPPGRVVGNFELSLIEAIPN